MEYIHLTELLNNIGKTAKDTYKLNLKKRGVYATGKLYNSIGYRLNITDNGIKLVFLAEDYWINIEEGRKVGSKMPPVSMIRKWMISKGIPDNKGTAYIIARNISKKGIKPKPILREIKLKLKDYSDDITKALTMDLEDAIKEKLTINNK